MNQAGGSEAGAARVRIGDLWIDRLTFAAVLEEIEQLVGERRGGAVFTPNIDHVVNAARDRSLRDAYTRVSLSVPDGQLLVWASRLLGTALPEKISGSDLVPRVLELARKHRWRVYLLGGGAGVPRLAAARLVEMGIEVAGAEGPLVGVEPLPDEAALIERVRAAKADVVLVGLGSPKQERFIDRSAAQLAPALLFGIGASLDFLAGTVKRAPRWVSDAGLEWLYRLLQEPRRLAPRYFLNDPWFAVIVCQMLLTARADRIKAR